MPERGHKYTGPTFSGEVWRRIRVLLKGYRSLTSSEASGIALGGLGGAALLGPIGALIGMPVGVIGRRCFGYSW